MGLVVLRLELGGNRDDFKRTDGGRNFEEKGCYLGDKKGEGGKEKN